jgi:hypothetical protein
MDNFWSEKYHEAAKSGDNRCIACGKKTGKITQGVFIGGGGDYIVHPDDYEIECATDGAGWMGWFAVGNECIKVVPKEFRYATTIQENGAIK